MNSTVSMLCKQPWEKHHRYKEKETRGSSRNQCVCAFPTLLDLIYVDMSPGLHLCCSSVLFTHAILAETNFVFGHQRFKHNFVLGLVFSKWTVILVKKDIFIIHNILLAVFSLQCIVVCVDLNHFVRLTLSVLTASQKYTPDRLSKDCFLELW